jgi:small subunit ribosomal protein S9
MSAEDDERAEQPTEGEPAAEAPEPATQETEVPEADAQTQARQPPAESATDGVQPESELTEQPQEAEQSAAEETTAAEPPSEEDEGEVQEPEREQEREQESPPRTKPEVPGAHLEVDIVPEGVDPLGREESDDPYAIEDEEQPEDGVAAEAEEEEELVEPIATAAIDLAADARYRATGKRKTAIARVTLKPGSGTYLVNGRALEDHFPRISLQRSVRQPLETVGYQDRMDVVARLHGGGVSAQAGALRHGVSRALLEADPNLRGELKRRGFLTRDSRAKERKKAGLKKARKRPQFSKR